jgi:hypothetical protein
LKVRRDLCADGHGDLADGSNWERIESAPRRVQLPQPRRPNRSNWGSNWERIERQSRAANRNGQATSSNWERIERPSPSSAWRGPSSVLQQLGKN